MRAAPHCWLSAAQCARLQPRLPPKGRGGLRGADRRVLSGLIPGTRNGLRGRAAPACSGPPKTLSHRFGRWRQAGLFKRVFAALARAGGAPAPGLIDAPPLQAHRTAARLLTKGRFRAAWGAPGAAATRNALILLLPAGQGSAYRGAAPVRPVRPDAEGLSAAKGEASDRGRTALAQRALTPWIPRRATRKQPLSSEAALYKQRNRIERRFDRLKDWRRRTTRSDRWAHTFFSARCLAATLLCWV